MGDIMKIEKNIIIGLIIILVCVTIFILTKNYINYSNTNRITSNPFNTIEIVGKKLRLKDNQRTYDLEVDCSNLKENEQITYYRLNEDYKEFKISINTKIFKDKKIIEKDLNEATALDINISVMDEKEKYEQVIHINATCLEKEDYKLD